MKIYFLLPFLFFNLVVHSQVEDSMLFDWTVRNTDFIFEGKVIESESFWAKGQESMMTRHVIDVSKFFKGKSKKFMEIVTLGGSMENISQSWTHTTQFSVGQEGMFFCKNITDLEFSDNPFILALGTNGFIQYTMDEIKSQRKRGTQKLYSDIYKDLYDPLREIYGLEADILGTNSIEDLLIENNLGLQVKTTNTDILIEFIFENIIFDQLGVVEFDIMTKSNQEDIKFAASDVYISYSNEAFGEDVVANEKIEATKETVIENDIYTLALTDDTAETVKFLINAGLEPNQLYSLSQIAEKFLHIKIDVDNIYELATLSFDALAMENQSFFYDEATGTFIGFDKIAVDDSAFPFLIPHIKNFHPNPITAGTGDTLFIEGTGFGTMKGMVKFPNADNGGSGMMIATDKDISWSDTLIKVRMPSRDGSFSDANPAGSGKFEVIAATSLGMDDTTGLNITYAVRNLRVSLTGEAFRSHLADDILGDGTADSILFLRPDQNIIDSNLIAIDIIKDAMCDWTSQTGIQWNLGAAIPTGSSSNSVNIIKFTNGSTLGNATASTRTSFLTCDDFSQFPPLLVPYNTEFDILIRGDLTSLSPPSNSWNFSTTTNPAANQFDFYSVILHELGHVHNIKHVIPDTKIMYYKLGPGTTRRIITPDDAAAGGDILNESHLALNIGDNNCPLAVPTGGSCLTPTIDIIKFKSIAIYPNPTSHSLTIKLEDFIGGDTRIKIFNLLGQEVSNSHLGNLPTGNFRHKIDLSILPSGLYSITLEQSDLFHLGKVIKL